MSRPKFSAPPLVEVALAVQFQPIVDLQAPQIGLFWARFREEFPDTRELRPLPHVVEEFDTRGRSSAGGLSVQALGPQPRRFWFLNESGSQLIQLQQDRLMFNWRKVEDGEYPHSAPIHKKFREILFSFTRFLEEERLGEIQPDQAEVIYIDRLPPGEGWQRPGELDRVLTVWAPGYSDAFLPEPEEVRVSIKYLIRDGAGDPLGRLHISVEPAHVGGADVPSIFIRTTARGRPVGDGVDGALQFLEIGHDWAARAFASITTPSMHKVWERIDDDR